MLDINSSLYRFLRKVYESTNYYKLKIRKMNEEIAVIKGEVEKKNSEYLIKYFSDDLKILSGPFEGMKYIRKSSGSTLFPKLIGCYEEAIQNIVTNSILRHYDKIIDIGCAEGYYAVGFAYKCPNSKVVASDIDEIAINNLLQLIEVNNISNVEIKNNGFDCISLNAELEGKEDKLIVCDIEGYELELLDIEKVPNLGKVDLIIESHDCFKDGLTEILIDRFYNTHVIEIIVNYSFLVNSYEKLKGLPKEVVNYMTDEQRPSKMKFLYLKSIPR